VRLNSTIEGESSKYAAAILRAAKNSTVVQIFLVRGSPHLKPWEFCSAAGNRKQPGRDSQSQAGHKFFRSNMNIITTAAFPGHERQNILSKDQERELIRKAQSGDKQAGSELLARFRRLVLSTVQKHKPSSRDLFEELVAVGMAALWDAIVRFDLGRNFRLATYAARRIKGAISDEVKAARRRGGVGETREERYAYYHRNVDAVTEHFGCSVKDAEAAITEVKAREQHYLYDEDEWKGGDRPPRLAPIVADPSRTLLKLISHRVGQVIDLAERQADSHAVRRLREIGRRAFANELVLRDHAQAAARNEPDQYLYPRLRRVEATNAMAA
jgi:RNA polymerase sigma factor (sigma-70 family)